MAKDNPYIGLEPFGEDDFFDFFGRDAQVRDLIEKIRRQRFVAVVGPSGSGKSSLVRAGALPHFRAGVVDWNVDGRGWNIVAMKPGDDPFRSLAESLYDQAGVRLETAADGAPDAGESARDRAVATVVKQLQMGRAGLASMMSNLQFTDRNDGMAPSPFDRTLLLVDQFEELFRLTSGAGAFINALVAAAADPSSNVHVVITLRTDHLNECAEYPELVDAINAGLFFVSRMTEEQVREAITGPADRRHGVRIDDQLVELLLETSSHPFRDVQDSVESQDDRLPILQHALMRLWDSLDDDEGDGDGPKVIKFDQWDQLLEGDRTNNPRHVLHLHAESVYQGFSPKRRRIAEILFTRITLLDPDGDRLVRARPTPLRDIIALAGCEPSDMSAVIDAFAKKGVNMLERKGPAERFSDGFVEVAHEAVIRHWRRLRGWCHRESKRRKEIERLAEQARSQGKRRHMFEFGQIIRTHFDALSENDVARGTALFNELDSYYGSSVARWAARYGLSIREVITYFEDSRYANRQKRFALAISSGEVLDIFKFIEEGVELETGANLYERKALEVFVQAWQHPLYYAIFPQFLTDAEMRGPDEPGRLREWRRTRSSLTRHSLEESETAEITDVHRRYFAERKDARSGGDFSVMHFAAISGNTKLLALLRDLGGDLEAKNARLTTVFDMAVLARRRRAAEWIHKELGEQPDKTLVHVNKLGMTPLHWAALREAPDIARWILAEHPAAAERRGLEGERECPIHHVYRNAKPDTVGVFLEAGADANVQTASGDTPLILAARAASTEVVRRLLAHRDTDPALANSKEQTALLAAASADLDPQADPGALARIDATVELLLDDARSNPRHADTDGDTALHAALRMNDGDAVVARMIDKQLLVDAMNAKGETPLVMALRRGRTDLALAMVMRGACENGAGAVDDWLEAALRLSANEYGAPSRGEVNPDHVFEKILERWPVTEDTGRSALVAAAELGQDWAVRRLARGVPIDSRDASGRSPMMAAYVARSYPTIRLLKSLGAEERPPWLHRVYNPGLRDWEAVVDHDADRFGLDAFAAFADRLPPPVFPDDEWTQAGRDAANEVLTELLRTTKGRAVGLIADVRGYRERQLPFYADVKLVEALIKPEDVAPGVLTLLVRASGHAVSVIQLDGTLFPIRRQNRDAGLALADEGQVRDYVRFVCSLGYGVFSIYEADEDVRRRHPGPEGPPAELPQPRPTTVTGPDDDGVWSARARVQYLDTLYDVDFRISPAPDGVVEFADDDVIQTQLPIAAGVYKQGLRVMTS